MHEQMDGHARNRADAATIARNNAKWMAATKWADRHSAEFVVLNEDNLFAFHDARSPRKHPVKTYAATHATKPLTKGGAGPRTKTATKPKGKPTRSRSRSSMASKVRAVGRSRRARKA